MAEDAVEAAISAAGLQPQYPSRTLQTMLVGGHEWTPLAPVSLRRDFGLDKDIAEHLSRNYGDRSRDIAELAKQPAPGPSSKSRTPTNLSARLAPGYPFIEAEVLYGARQEYATTAVDVLARRTRLAFLDRDAAAAAAPRVVELLAGELGWSKKRREREANEVARFLSTMHCTPSALQAPSPAPRP
eukprot:tig00021036_g17308.t1